jgi:hypothetical protein
MCGLQVGNTVPFPSAAFRACPFTPLRASSERSKGTGSAHSRSVPTAPAKSLQDTGFAEPHVHSKVRGYQYISMGTAKPTDSHGEKG